MVAIVQSDPYQALGRKIGYSVGLESLRRNTLLLNEIYSKKGNVSYSDWKLLVSDLGRSGKDDRPVIEIANFLSTLKLIRIFGNELHILYGLDILSILKRYFDEDDTKYQKSVDTVLTFLLLEADGDIFLNCLAANFDSSQTKLQIEHMITIKWEKLKSAFSNPALLHKIWEIISIKSLDKEKAQTHKPSNPFEGSGQNHFLRRTEALAEKPQNKALVQESYLKKVLPTRKGWAKDLGYFDSSYITTLGVNLLDNLSYLKLENSPAMCFWPYEHELEALRIDAQRLGAPQISSWKILNSIILTLSKKGNATPKVLSNKEVLDLLWEIYQLYKKGSSDRGAIRHQLPLYIIRPVLAAICIANNYKPIPLDDILEEEYRRPERIVNYTNIRGTEGAIIFKSKP